MSYNIWSHESRLFAPVTADISKVLHYRVRKSPLTAMLVKYSDWPIFINRFEWLLSSGSSSPLCFMQMRVGRSVKTQLSRQLCFDGLTHPHLHKTKRGWWTWRLSRPHPPIWKHEEKTIRQLCFDGPTHPHLHKTQRGWWIWRLSTPVKATSTNMKKTATFYQQRYKQKFRFY